jgi:hypothetical protein
MSDPEHLARLKKGSTVETPTLPNLRLTLTSDFHLHYNVVHED